MIRLLTPIGLVVLLGAAVDAQTRSAAMVLRDMRAALGGEAALDAVRTLSVSGSASETMGSIRKGFSLEWVVMLPDHFMTVKGDFNTAAPRPIDITYYRGFAGDALIQRVDSNIPFPPDPGPQTPQAVAERERNQLRNQQRTFARFFVAFFGTSPSAYPLDFSYVGQEVVDASPTEVVEGGSADGFVLRLYVDAATHLPAVVAWQAPPPVLITTSSTAIVRGDQIVSQSPPQPVPPGDPGAGLAPVTWRLVLSDFKVQDGLNWPHRLRVMIGPREMEDTRLGKFKINPKIDARKFNVGNGKRP